VSPLVLTFLSLSLSLSFILTRACTPFAVLVTHYEMNSTWLPFADDSANAPFERWRIASIYRPCIIEKKNFVSTGFSESPLSPSLSKKYQPDCVLTWPKMAICPSKHSIINGEGTAWSIWLRNAAMDVFYMFSEHDSWPHARFLFSHFAFLLQYRLLYRAILFCHGRNGWWTRLYFSERIFFEDSFRDWS